MITTQVFTILSFIASIILLSASSFYFFSVKRKAREILSGNKVYDMQKKAEDEVSAILTDAQEKAKKLLIDTEFIKKNIVQDLDANLQRIAANSIKQLEEESAAYNNQYKQVFASITQEHTKMLEQLEDTLKEVETLKEKMLKEFQENIKQVSSDSANNLSNEVKQFNTEYKQMIEDIKADYLKKSQETLSILEKIPEDEIRDYKEILKKETLKSQEAVGEEIGQELGEVQKEISEYKNEKMKEVESSVDEILHRVTKDVVAKSLSEEEHKRLIVNALEQAQAEGILGKAPNSAKNAA